MENPQKGVFISHLYNEHEHYLSVLDKISQTCPTTVYNYSCARKGTLFTPITNPSVCDIREKIKKQIKLASLLVMVLSYYSDCSPWTVFEAKQARICQLPIIGVWPSTRRTQLNILKFLDMEMQLDDEQFTSAIYKYFEFPQNKKAQLKQT